MKYAKTGFIAFLIYGSLHIILYAQEWEWENTLLEGSNAAYTIIQTEYDNILYAGTGRNGKIFKSIDNGETWETAGDLENATSNGIYFLYMTIVDANGKRISNNGIKLIYIQ